MQLDDFTVNVLVAVTTLSVGIMYLLETMLRRETRVAQVWVLVYLWGMLTVIAYLAWKSAPEPLMAIGVGNAALVATVGSLWLGCLRHNGRRLRLASVLVGAASVTAFAMVLVDRSDAGDWAGAPAMFTGVALFAALGAIESRRARMGSTPTTIGLTVVLAVVAAYYGTRCGVLLAVGADATLFRTWFGSSVTGTITIVLMIVVLVTTTTLRHDTVAHADDHEGSELRISADGVLDRRSFAIVTGRTLQIERREDRRFGLIAFRADDLPQIGIAFGAREQEAVSAMCRRSIRRYAPAMAPVGEYGRTGLLVAMEAGSASEVRRAAGRIQRLVLDDLAERGSAVIPVIGVGVAMNDPSSDNVHALMKAAFDAAGRAASSSETSVMVAD